MELEVGVRITRDTGDLTFASTETEAFFILAARLPGFTTDEIEVAMNEGDSQIIIRGGGHIAFQEAVITSRVAITREVSIECFDESFPVPDRVDLDGIDAWFDEEEKILIISIPKLLTNECSWIGEEESVEHPIQEDRQTREPTEEKNGTKEDDGIKMPHDKPKSERLPEPIELHQQDGKPQLEITDQVMETKHPTKSQETEEEIQKQEQKHEKPATVEKDKKSKDVRLPEKELRSLDGFKDDEAGQLKGPDIDAFRTKELSLDLHKQKTEKPTLKVPKETREAAEPTRTEKVEPEQRQQEEQEAQEQKMPIGRSPEKTTMKFQGPKELGQKHKQDRVSAPEQVLEAAQHIQSEMEEELKQYEHEGQGDTKPIVVPAFEKPKAAEVPQMKESKPWVYEFYEDEDHQWIGPDREPSKTRMSIELEEKYKKLEQEEEIIKQKTEKPTEKAQKQLFQVAESTKLDGEKEAKKEAEQIEEQEAHEYKKPIIQPPHEEVSAKKLSEPNKTVQAHEKVGVKELEELVLPTPKAPKPKGAPKRQESSRKKESEEFEKSIAGPVFKAPKIKEFTSLEEQRHDLPELKQWIYGFKEDEDRQLKDTNREAFETTESMKPKELSLDLQKLKTEKETLKAPKAMSEAADLIKTGKEEKVETKLHQPEELEKKSEQHEQDLKKQEKTAVVQTCEKPKAAEYAGKEEPKQQICELQEDKKELLQQEQVIMKQKAEKPTKKVQKRFEEATEPAQSEEEEKEAKQEPDQSKEQEAPGRQIQGMPTYEVEQEQEFQISAEKGREHEIIAESLETEKQEEIILKEPTTLEKESKPMLEHIESKVHQKPAVEAPYQTPDMIDFKTPGITKKKEQQQREQLDRKPKKWDKTTLFELETEKYKIPIADSLEIKGIPESHEPYEKPGESLHVEAEMQLKPPGETKAQKTACSAVGAQLPGKPTVGPSEQESQTKQLEQATDFSIPHKQQKESEQTKKHEGPLQQFMEDESKDQPEQQFKQPDEEEAQKRASPPEQELARNGATLEPPDRAARTNAVVETVMEQKLYRAEEGELQQDIKSPKSQKPPPIPSEIEGGQVPEHDETTLEPPKPLPRARETMELTGSPPLLTMEKEATEPTITPPRIRGAMEPEGSPLLPSSDEETMEREFPTLIQKEMHPISDLQNADEQKTTSRQMPEFEESAEEQEEKTKEPPPPHRAQEEIQRPTEDELHKIFEVPQPTKILEREFKIYAPKELEEEQELNPPLPLDRDKKTLEEEVSSDEVEASCAEMDKNTNVTKLSSRRRFHCRCRGRRPAYPIPPSTLLSGSAFAFSIMILVFHFIKRKKPN